MWCCHCSVAKLCPALCDSVNCSTLGFSVLHYLPEFAHIHVHWVGDAKYLILCHLLFFPLFFSSIRVFSIESTLSSGGQSIGASASATPSSEYSGLISFRIDWFDLLEVHRTLKSLLQHHSSKASVLWCSAFFMVQLPSIHDYWKNHSFD